MKKKTITLSAGLSSGKRWMVISVRIAQWIKCVKHTCVCVYLILYNNTFIIKALEKKSIKTLLGSPEKFIFILFDRVEK